MMINTVSQIKDQLADREAIKDCLYRYCRGIDRLDMELLRSAYWPDATDEHTGFSGTIDEFIEFASSRIKKMAHNIHLIGNILIELHGVKAAVESYFSSVGVRPQGSPRAMVVGGRYLDKFERRNDEWRIAKRVLVHDWFHEYAETGDWAVGPFGLTDLKRGKRAPQDESYAWLGLN